MINKTETDIFSDMEQMDSQDAAVVADVDVDVDVDAFIDVRALKVKH